ncbi:hypothetical protein MUP79_06055 [Candidatus Bathyarchaeota archaeon]|nr:hypothetical protein [Candidatus Bathyarchaeota archaeon]
MQSKYLVTWSHEDGIEYTQEISPLGQYTPKDIENVPVKFIDMHRLTCSKTIRVLKVTQIQ